MYGCCRHEFKSVSLHGLTLNLSYVTAGRRQLHRTIQEAGRKLGMLHLLDREQTRGWEMCCLWNTASKTPQQTPPFNHINGKGELFLYKKMILLTFGWRYTGCSLCFIYIAGDGLGQGYGLGFMCCTEVGGGRSRDLSLCNVNIFCTVQCSHWVWNLNQSLCPCNGNEPLQRVRCKINCSL